jgi:hypothetical protein
MKGNKEVEQTEIVSNSDDNKTETETKKSFWYKPAFSENQCKFLADNKIISATEWDGKLTYTGALKTFLDSLIVEYCKKKNLEFPIESRELRSGEKKKEKAVNDVMKIAPNMTQSELIELAKKLNSLIQ